MGWTRRAFLVCAGAMAGGFAVGAYLYKRPYPNPLAGNLSSGEATLNRYIKIGADDSITIITPRAEMGQGIHTALATLVADELGVPLSMVTTEHGLPAPAYYNRVMLREGVPFLPHDKGFLAETMRDGMEIMAKFLAMQMTGGSTSIPDAFEPMRLAGAAARTMLINAAAEELKIAPGKLTIEDGQITDGANTHPIGKFAAKAAEMGIPSDVEPKPASEYKLIGKKVARLDIPAKSTGAAEFGIDKQLPGMMYATIRMNPYRAGGGYKLDDEALKAQKGVKEFVRLKDGFAVIATDTWRAMKAAEAANVEWEKPSKFFSQEEYEEVLSKALQGGGDVSTFREEGDAASALSGKKNVITADYSAPFMAHATLEPINCTAHFDSGVLKLWFGNQAPGLAQAAAAKAAGLEPEQVEVHTTLMGGGFGRRAEVEVAAQAAEIAMQLKGTPIKLTWSREEDTIHDVYRPAAKARFAGQMGENGVPTALFGRLAVPSVMKSAMPRLAPGTPVGGPDGTMAQGAHDQAYGIENYLIEAAEVDTPLPIGFWRSVGNSQNAFFHESFLDELANSADVDPVEMHLKLLKNHGPEQKVIERAAELAGWGNALPQGHAQGFAYCKSFGTPVAQIVEVKASDDGIKLVRAIAVADVGTIVSPDSVAAQIEGAMVWGLSAAIMGAITLEEGKVAQNNFDTFELIRMDKVPPITVEVLENQHEVSGAGEPGVPPAAPALANAIFAATGKRLRRMPFSDDMEFV
ncbi:MAG: molybdopterin cofactor-binding domain-containing protein [Hyphomicrobiales bacterium]